MKQAQAFDLLKDGHNVLLTGPAGSGKTFLLNRFIGYLKEKKIGVAITASTGIAATHINGRTIHSWAGIGIKDRLSAKEIQSLVKKPHLKKQFAGVKVLIIDEISMLPAHRLDLVNRVCQAFSKNLLPFGGLQLVMCGDFFQLPPISSGGITAEFVYKADVWAELDLRVCYLAEQHRQSDKQMSKILNSIRLGTVGEETVKLLRARIGQFPAEGEHPVRLYTHNVDVDLLNRAELNRLPGKVHSFRMSQTGEDRIVDSLKKNCLAPEELLLKEGAAVMFIKNKFKDEATLYVNGSSGTIAGFNDEGFPIVRLRNGGVVTVGYESWTIENDERVLAKINQLPLRLAWAITVHKSQGMTLEAAQIDLRQAFGYGMGYVALSRLTSLQGLFLLGINDMAYKLHPDVFRFDQELLALSAEAGERRSRVHKIQGALFATE